MKCDNCNNDAHFNLLIFVDGVPRQISLCPSCYQDKMQEMMDAMPEEWTQFLSGQADLSQMEDLPFFDLKNFELDEDSLEMSIEGMTFVNDEHKEVYEKLINILFGRIEDQKEEEQEEESESVVLGGRDKAFATQRDALARKKRRVRRALNQAMAAEDYEACALYRDQIENIDEDLIRIEEERKNPYGV